MFPPSFSRQRSFSFAFWEQQLEQKPGIVQISTANNSNKLTLDVCTAVLMVIRAEAVEKLCKVQCENTENVQCRMRHTFTELHRTFALANIFLSYT